MRTLLVDDQRMFREGLRALFRERGGVEIVGETPSARQAYELVRRLRPEMVVTELLLPGVDGVTAAREIRKLHPGCKILVLTACTETVRLQSAWLSGIDACVTKDESVDTLMLAIASLRAGRRFVSPALRRTRSGASMHGRLAGAIRCRCSPYVNVRSSTSSCEEPPPKVWPRSSVSVRRPWKPIAPTSTRSWRPIALRIWFASPSPSAMIHTREGPCSPDLEWLRYVRTRLRTHTARRNRSPVPGPPPEKVPGCRCGTRRCCRPDRDLRRTATGR
jgi:CheY-like chemotaxis protein